MRKTLLAACLVIAAFAVVPSLASAKPVLTHPTGSLLGIGSKITATNVGNTTMVTPIGTFTCSTAILTGELTQNNTANGFKATITSLGEGGTGTTIAGDNEPECTGSGIVGNRGMTWIPPYCVEGVEANDKLKVRGGACSEE